MEKFHKHDFMLIFRPIHTTDATDIASITHNIMNNERSISL